MLGGKRITDVTLSKLEVLLDLVEQFAAATHTINFHLHLSGYDMEGKMFWAQVVLDSPARRVLYLVYRYIESADSMLSGSTTLQATPGPATTAPSCRPAGSGATAGTTPPALPRPCPPPSANSSTLTASTPARAATPRIATTSAGAPLMAGAAPRADGARPGLPPSSSPAAASGSGGGANWGAGAESGARAGSGAAMPRSLAAASRSPPPPGSIGAGNGDIPAAGASDADGDDYAGSGTYGDTQTAAPSSGRHRKSVKSCPNTEHQPLPVIPSVGLKEVVMEFMRASTRPLTDMREAVMAMCNDVRKGDSVAKMRVAHPW